MYLQAALCSESNYALSPVSKYDLTQHLGYQSRVSAVYRVTKPRHNRVDLVGEIVLCIYEQFVIFSHLVWVVGALRRR